MQAGAIVSQMYTPLVRGMFLNVGLPGIEASRGPQEVAGSRQVRDVPKRRHDILPCRPDPEVRLQRRMPLQHR